MCMSARRIIEVHGIINHLFFLFFKKTAHVPAQRKSSDTRAWETRERRDVAENLLTQVSKDITPRAADTRMNVWLFFFFVKRDESMWCVFLLWDSSYLSGLLRVVFLKPEPVRTDKRATLST